MARDTHARAAHVARCVQSNRLDSMLGLEECVALEELYLSHNGIWKIEVGVAGGWGVGGLGSKGLGGWLGRGHLEDRGLEWL